jgi:hypothetical protein
MRRIGRTVVVDVVLKEESDRIVQTLADGTTTSQIRRVPSGHLTRPSVPPIILALLPPSSTLRATHQFSALATQLAADRRRDCHETPDAANLPASAAHVRTAVKACRKGMPSASRYRRQSPHLWRYAASFRQLYAPKYEIRQSQAQPSCPFSSMSAGG